MSGTPFRRRYRDALAGRRRHTVYHPTSTSPLWRRYLASLFDVPRTPRPRPPARPARAGPARLPLILVLAAVAASLMLGGATAALLRTGSDHAVGNPPVSSPPLPTDEPDGDSEGGTSGGATGEPSSGENPSTLGPPPPPPTDVGNSHTPPATPDDELPQTGPSAFPLPLALLGLFLLVAGGAGLLLTRARRGADLHRRGQDRLPSTERECVRRRARRISVAATRRAARPPSC
ncbi:LPXTG cell wall anchor domain-containing protein [Streptomyces canus]|uniref:LPXTG cell wall anchor domain-containing protein n=1 Tax=Streptomyces canus TaxID=58343 RepID=UPI003251A954